MGDQADSAGGTATLNKNEDSIDDAKEQREQSRATDEAGNDRTSGLTSLLRSWPYYMTLVVVVMASMSYLLGSGTPPESWNNMVGNFPDFNASNLPFNADWIQKHVGFDKTSAYKRVPDRIGVQLANKGVRAKYPIVLVPGFVTSGLELWSAQECFKGMSHSHLSVRLQNFSLIKYS
jgi:hypothetical protein